MQRPTCTDLHVRSVSDAVLIMHAVAAGIRPMVTRRLDNESRHGIKSGNVYVWEERGPHTDVTGIGIERWTDGIGWGPSRVRDGFLFYSQKIPPHQRSLYERAGYGEQDHALPILTKQTYTAHVKTGNVSRKWHLIAYYIQDRISQLHTVDDYTDLLELDVPVQNYSSARAPKGRPDQITIVHPHRRRNSLSASPLYRPYPQSRTYSGGSDGERSPSSSPSPASPSPLYSPYYHEQSGWTNGQMCQVSSNSSLPTTGRSTKGGVQDLSGSATFVGITPIYYSQQFLQSPWCTTPLPGSAPQTSNRHTLPHPPDQPSDRDGRKLPPLAYENTIPTPPRDSFTEAQINSLPENGYLLESTHIWGIRRNSQDQGTTHCSTHRHVN